MQSKYSGARPTIRSMGLLRAVSLNFPPSFGFVCTKAISAQVSHYLDNIQGLRKIFHRKSYHHIPSVYNQNQGYSMTTNSIHLSTANGHCWRRVFFLCTTRKLTLITSANFIFVADIPTAAIRVLSTKISTDDESSYQMNQSHPGWVHTWIPCLVQARLGTLSPTWTCWCSMCLCFSTRSLWFAYMFVNPSIALHKGSQLDTDVLEPNTMVNTRQYTLFIVNPKAPTKPEWIFGILKQAFIFTRATYITLSEKLTLKLYSSQ